MIRRCCPKVRFGANSGRSVEEREIKRYEAVTLFANTYAEACRLIGVFLLPGCERGERNSAAPHAPLTCRSWWRPKSHSDLHTRHDGQCEVPCVLGPLPHHWWPSSYFSRSLHRWWVGMVQSGNDACWAPEGPLNLPLPFISLKPTSCATLFMVQMTGPGSGKGEWDSLGLEIRYVYLVFSPVPSVSHQPC